ELDPRVLLLAGPPLGLVAVAGPRQLVDLVLDPGVVERLLHLPAGGARALDPHVLSAVKDDGHGASLPPLASPHGGAGADRQGAEPRPARTTIAARTAPPDTAASRRGA